MTVRDGPLIDMHSHWKTRRGYPLRTDKELSLQTTTWRSAVEYATEEEMADDLRRAGVRAILDFGYSKFVPIEEAKGLHDYAFEMQRRYPDVVLGNWLHFQPELGAPALDELRRCLDRSAGFIGLAVSGSLGVPASDGAYDPFYALCIEENVPALIFVGHTGLGAGIPGGLGVILDHCHPRHLDLVAARYPELKIVAARPAWPWQTEMISVMLHKANVWYELHGWSPKYFTADLKHEIPRRLKDRIMFGADYPLLTYERLLNDWDDLGLSDEVMDGVLRGNAMRFLSQVRGGDGSGA
jgi:predicted TIM-barrel fold metal-dependent hydrolase